MQVWLITCYTSRARASSGKEFVCDTAKLITATLNLTRNKLSLKLVSKPAEKKVLIAKPNSDVENKHTVLFKEDNLNTL